MNKINKLLIMGTSTGTKEALLYAKKLGIYTIITDFYPVERNHLKRTADEYWMIDVGNLDILEQKCREEQVTGIFASTSEFCLDKTRELCRRLGLPFYASDEGWTCARNKLQFKQRCMECGLDVPKLYQLEEPLTVSSVSEITYSVIIKPVDSCAQQGLSLCRNGEELLAGYERALEASPSRRVLIEEYILGDEIDVFYFIQNGKPLLTSMNDKYFMLINERRNASFQPGPSQYYAEYAGLLSDKIEKLFRKMDCQKGNVFLQAIRRDGRYYFLEMGYRIDGIGTWVNSKPQTGFSNVEQMVDLALGRQPSVDIEKDVDFDPRRQNNANYLFWARPGRVSVSTGLEEVKAMEGVNVVVERFHEGDIIPKADSMFQMAYYIGIIGKSQREVVDKLKKINETLHLYDPDGRELLTPFTDYSVLEKRCFD